MCNHNYCGYTVIITDKKKGCKFFIKKYLAYHNSEKINYHWPSKSHP